MTRKVVTRAPHREVGVVNPAWLLDHAVEHESHLERRFIMVALACPVVLDIVHQPLQLTLVVDSGQGPTERKYTPDFRLTLADGTEVIVECKPAKFVDQNQNLFAQAEAALKVMGYAFLIVTDDQIDRAGLSSRALLLTRYGRLNVSAEDALQCRQLIEEFGGDAQVSDLLEQGLSEATIWNLVARHQLKVPVGLPMTEISSVCINNHVEEDCHDYFCSWLGAPTR